MMSTDRGGRQWMSTDIRGKLVVPGWCLLIEEVDSGCLLTLEVSWGYLDDIY